MPYSILINSNRTASEIENSFRNLYPGLKLDILSETITDNSGSRYEHLTPEARLRCPFAVFIICKPTLLVSELMSVFRERLGVLIRVSRKKPNGDFRMLQPTDELGKTNQRAIRHSGINSNILHNYRDVQNDAKDNDNFYPDIARMGFPWNQLLKG